MAAPKWNLADEDARYRLSGQNAFSVCDGKFYYALEPRPKSESEAVRNWICRKRAESRRWRCRKRAE